jgi:hypothetical protein
MGVWDFAVAAGTGVNREVIQVRRRGIVPRFIGVLLIAVGLCALAAAMWWPVLHELFGLEEAAEAQGLEGGRDLVYLRDGSAFAGEIVSIDEAELRIRGARDASGASAAGTAHRLGEDATIRMKDVAEITLQGRYAASMPRAPRVYLRDGSILVAAPCGSEDETGDSAAFRCKGPEAFGAGREFALSISDIAGISFSGWCNPFTETAEADVISLRGGGRIDGTIRGVGAARVGILKPLDETTQYVDCATIQTMTFSRRAAAARDVPEGRLCVVSVTDGSRIKGGIISVSDETVVVMSPLVGKVSIMRYAVERIEFSSWAVRDEFPVVLTEEEKSPVALPAAGSAQAAAVLIEEEEARVAPPAAGRARGTAASSKDKKTRIAVVSYDGVRRLVKQETAPSSRSRVTATPRGTCLIADVQGNAVTEMRENGRVLWEFTAVETPTGALRLPTGNTLICDFGHYRLIEVDAGKNVVWSVKADGAMGCCRGKRGRTLIVENYRKRLVEVDKAGNVVWEAAGLDDVIDACRLEDGNTVVLCGAEELTLKKIAADGKVIWEVKGFSYPAKIIEGREDRIVICESDSRKLTILDNFGRRKRVVDLRPQP